MVSLVVRGICMMSAPIGGFAPACGDNLFGFGEQVLEFNYGRQMRSAVLLVVLAADLRHVQLS